MKVSDEDINDYIERSKAIISKYVFTDMRQLILSLAELRFDSGHAIFKAKTNDEYRVIAGKVHNEIRELSLSLGIIYQERNSILELYAGMLSSKNISRDENNRWIFENVNVSEMKSLKSNFMKSVDSGVVVITSGTEGASSSKSMSNIVNYLNYLVDSISSVAKSPYKEFRLQHYEDILGESMLGFELKSAINTLKTKNVEIRGIHLTQAMAKLIGDRSFRLAESFTGLYGDVSSNGNLLMRLALDKRDAHAVEWLLGFNIDSPIIKMSKTDWKYIRNHDEGGFHFYDYAMSKGRIFIPEFLQERMKQVKERYLLSKNLPEKSLNNTTFKASAL